MSAPSTRRRRSKPLREVGEGVFNILATHRGAGTVTELTRDLGISSAVFYRWLEQDTEFREAVNVIRERADDTVVSKLFQRAVGYTAKKEKPMKVKGKAGSEDIEIVEYNEHVAPDVGAQKMWLTNRRPEEWVERKVVDDGDSYRAMLDRMSKVIEGEAKDVTDGS